MEENGAFIELLPVLSGSHIVTFYPYGFVILWMGVQKDGTNHLSLLR
jgi:hypothetical protein